jgi:putative PIN family toxin of toxin-antitoxin system
MIKAVFDTVVFVQALLNYRTRWARLLFERAYAYRLFVSEPILLEVLEVLQRPEIITKFRTLEGQDLRRVLEILSQAEVVTPSPLGAVSRDPKDDKLLAAADAAGADYLVSEDQDLLVLEKFRGVTIVDAATFLGILEQREPEVSH